MVSDHQVRRLRRLDLRGLPRGRAAAQAGMDDKTARKYRRLGRLPSEVSMEHHWRTKPDPFADVWPQLGCRVPTGRQAGLGRQHGRDNSCLRCFNRQGTGLPGITSGHAWRRRLARRLFGPRRLC